MGVFSWLRPLVRIANALERIATCQEFLAAQVAAQNNVLWDVDGHWNGIDESELLTTRSLEEQEQHEAMEQALFQHGGNAALLSAEDFLDEGGRDFDPVLDGRIPLPWLTRENPGRKGTDGR